MLTYFMLLDFLMTFSNKLLVMFRHYVSIFHQAEGKHEEELLPNQET